MGSEATIRYLKARLVVMEEELAGANAVSREREDKLTELSQRNKELEEEKAKSAKAADSAKVMPPEPNPVMSHVQHPLARAVAGSDRASLCLLLRLQVLA